MALPDKSPQNSQILRKLLQKAEQGGCITADDLLEIVPEIYKEKRQLDELTEILNEYGVETLLGEQEGAPVGGEEPAGLEFLASDDATSLYLREMSLTPLLTVEEELSLAKRVARGRQARRDLIRLNGHNPRIRQKLEGIVQDGRLARESLIKANTRLVVSIARRYVGRGVPFLDLIQEGNLGLIKAVEKYDYQRGFRFSTYATWWVRQGVVRSIADQGRTIRVPVHMADRLRLIYKTSQQLEQKLSRVPTLKELAAQLNLDGTKLRWILQVTQPPISLESPVGDEEDTELGMFVEDNNAPSPAQTAYENMLRERVDEVLATLTPREARILRLRFGLGQDRAYTLEEVGQKFGLTRERIRQIEGKALRRLRQPGRARLLRDYS